MWKIDPTTNIYTKTSMIIYKLRCRTRLLQWNYSMELRERGKGKENNDRASVTLDIKRCEGAGHKETYALKVLENCRWEAKEYWRVMEGFEWAKAKYTHSGHT
jgi:hypothetical protein